MRLRSPASGGPGHPAALNEAPVEIEQEHRAEESEDEATGRPDQDSRDDASEQRATEAEPDRRIPRHRIGARKGKPCQGSDDEAPDDETDDEDQHEVIMASGARPTACGRRG